MNAVFALYTVIATSLCLSTATKKLAGPEASFKKYIENSYFHTARHTVGDSNGVGFMCLGFERNCSAFLE